MKLRIALVLALVLSSGAYAAPTAQKGTVTGKMVDKKYVERGVVRILRVETMVEGKSERY